MTFLHFKLVKALKYPSKHAYMGPIWAISRQAHMGMPILDLYGTNMGKSIWVRPYWTHMGPILQHFKEKRFFVYLFL
jgi:hypothetical protein